MIAVPAFIAGFVLGMLFFVCHAGDLSFKVRWQIARASNEDLWCRYQSLMRFTRDQGIDNASPGLLREAVQEELASRLADGRWTGPTASSRVNQ